jgi:oxygen-independent coproporphyrinogen-3 oxidase
MDEWITPYINALCRELQEWKGKLTDYRVQTIYLGGGTPTLIPAEQIAYVLNLCTSIFHVEDDAEITIEANPGTVSKEQLSVLKDSGVNRLSIGLQAWQERHLQTLGRIHRNKDLLYSVDFARDAGLYNISIDVMFGLPGQTVDEWLETLYRVCMLGIEHVSTYSLKVEEGTLLYTWLNRGLISLPTQEEDRSMYYRGRDYLHQHGLEQYEISNFAVPGRECIHNLIYWNNGEYIGFGSGAHSFFNKERFSNYKGIKKYIDAVMTGSKRTEFRERIDEVNERFETIMLGLRLVKGISKKSFMERFGRDIYYYYGEAIKKLEEKNLLIDDGRQIRLTTRGMDVQNTVLLEFMGLN